MRPLRPGGAISAGYPDRAAWTGIRDLDVTAGTVRRLSRSGIRSALTLYAARTLPGSGGGVQIDIVTRLATGRLKAAAAGSQAWAARRSVATREQAHDPRGEFRPRCAFPPW